MIAIESLLSARLFLSPRRVGKRLYFISNLGGHLSLYAMDWGGSVPEPLLPPDIALQNPDLVGGLPFYVLPKLDKILVMIDQDGDEKYQPMLIPLSGGYPEPAFGGQLANCRVHLADCEAEQNIAYLAVESLAQQINEAFQADLAARRLVSMGQSRWTGHVAGVSDDHSRAIITEGYTSGDDVLYLWTRGQPRRLLYGTPLEKRREGQVPPLTGFGDVEFTSGGRLLLITALFDDAYGLGYLDLAQPDEIKPVQVKGAVHTGSGELIHLDHLSGDRYQLEYNIDGCSWAYEGSFDEASLTLTLDHVVCGQAELSNGVLEALNYEKPADGYALSFSAATSPAQIYTVSGREREIVRVHTRERLLGLPPEWLSPGEDASFESYDGRRISARLYLPAEPLGFKGPRSLVYYIHGGPQSQERPDFTWFSMPLIQFLTLNGLAVFVPNARGSSGYGLNYMKQVDRDWGGADRLDHVHAMGLLRSDKRVDAARAGVVGRSYGGYMTLTLAARHPELWSAACDMFGPYDLLSFSGRIPETWKPYFSVELGDPEKDREMLVERSPSTYMHQIACPLLVIQGKNDPRVVEPESRQVVEDLRAQGKQVDYLMFEDEGHDVLKFKNRVRCYNAITDFFKRHLM
jgi:pimeloyl-ACP methyl ester carboxylesterase